MGMPGTLYVILLFLLTIQQFGSGESLLSINRLKENATDHQEQGSKISRADFPEGFMFGTSTSAFQVEGATTEGGRGFSNWDKWTATPGNIADGSNATVAVDQYHRYEDDLDLMAALNMDAYRFSIAWTRIFPDGYGPETNKEGIAYYNRLIDGLISRGITPFVTLFHWDLPQTFEDSFGGWLDRQMVPHFLRYVEVCFAAFGDRVKHWLTMNEPGRFARFGYSDGFYPPGRTTDGETEAYLVAHNLLLGHGAAVDLYRTKFQSQQKGIIGITIDGQHMVPLTNSSTDREVAETVLEFQLAMYLDPLFFGDYPAKVREYVGSRLPIFSEKESVMLKGSTDFISLNHYTTCWVTTGPGPEPYSKSTLDLDERATLLVERDGIQIGPKAASPWLYIVPWGLNGILKWIAERYDSPIYITENGMDDSVDLPFEDAVHDSQRVKFYEDYLAAVLQAIREGVNVRAYFAWSFLDNFEWADGYTMRFGLVYVDYEDDLKRYPKHSALWFQRFLRRLSADH